MVGEKAQQKAAEIATIVERVENVMPASTKANALCSRVWNAGKAAAGASGAFHMKEAYTAQELRAAWVAWGEFQTAVENADPPIAAFDTHRIGNGEAQDKSDREDIASRPHTHQMNFSITWKGIEQMIHVGLEGTENPKFKG